MSLETHGELSENYFCERSCSLAADKLYEDIKTIQHDLGLIVFKPFSNLENAQWPRQALIFLMDAFLSQICGHHENTIWLQSNLKKKQKGDSEESPFY
jgi:hypothetical protein